MLSFYRNFQRFVKNRNIVTMLKKLLMNATVTKVSILKLRRTVTRPTVTYASETWVLKENIIQKLLVFERKILKRNIWVYERKSNTEDKKNRNWTN